MLTAWHQHGINNISVLQHRGIVKGTLDLFHLPIPSAFPSGPGSFSSDLMPALILTPQYPKGGNNTQSSTTVSGARCHCSSHPLEGHWQRMGKGLFFSQLSGCRSFPSHILELMPTWRQPSPFQNLLGELAKGRVLENKARRRVHILPGNFFKRKPGVLPPVWWERPGVAWCGLLPCLANKTVYKLGACP